MRSLFVIGYTMLIAAGAAGSAAAQDDESPNSSFSFSANTTIASDYRFRGVSQTENDLTIQGGFDVAHKDGFYAGVWASNLSGWGTFGGSNTELDLYGGYKTSIDGITLDLRAIYYLFPQGASRTAYAEIYGAVGATVADIDLTIGANYAPKQDALSLDDVKEDNVYVFADAGYAIPETPVSITAHIGYTEGNAGAGPNGWVPSPTGIYVDWAIGASVALPWGPLEASITYVDTDISTEEAEAFQLINSGFRPGIAQANAVFAISASF